MQNIAVDGRLLEKKQSKLWLYHKPVGLIVSHQDEQGRDTIFDHLPLRERVISVGRLDKNTSGLLLLTNDGSLARQLELPENNFQRIYMVRVYGYLDFPQLQKILSSPITIDDITYRPIKISLEHSGKNREIRNILNYFDLRINRLIRIQYGPFALEDLAIGDVFELKDWQEYI